MRLELTIIDMIGWSTTIYAIEISKQFLRIGDIASNTQIYHTICHEFKSDLFLISFKTKNNIHLSANILTRIFIVDFMKRTQV